MDCFSQQPKWNFKKRQSTCLGITATFLMIMLCLLYLINRVLTLVSPQHAFVAMDNLQVVSDFGGFSFTVYFVLKALLLILPNGLEQQLVRDVFKEPPGGLCWTPCQKQREIAANKRIKRQLDLARFVRKQIQIECLFKYMTTRQERTLAM